MTDAMLASRRCRGWLAHLASHAFERYGERAAVMHEIADGFIWLDWACILPPLSRLWLNAAAEDALPPSFRCFKRLRQPSALMKMSTTSSRCRQMDGYHAQFLDVRR